VKRPGFYGHPRLGLDSGLRCAIPDAKAAKSACCSIVAPRAAGGCAVRLGISPSIVAA
jgi:hypothetical protein